MNATFDPPVITIAQLLQRLGDIPADRVRFTPTPGTATIDDLLKSENKLCELVEGTLVEKAMGWREAYLARALGDFIGPFIRAGNFGLSTGADGQWELMSGLVRLPDFAFAAWNRFPNGELPGEDDPIPNIVPDLAVEVLSRNNTRREMARKREEYFQAGVRLVWEIDPRARTVRAYSALDQFADLTAADTISGDPVLPGFTLPLAQLFAELDRHG